MSTRLGSRFGTVLDGLSGTAYASPNTRAFHSIRALSFSSMSDKIAYLSADGLEKLKAELVHLKTVRRRELAERIDAAKALGDLSENAEYHEAKDDLSFVEGRIAEVSDMIKNASIVTAPGAGGKINIGSGVEVEVNGKKKTYSIVGSTEADPVAGLVSNESPLGSAFIGHIEGDDVEVETPGGVTTYKILKVI